MRILSVDKGSVGEELGIIAGDEIVAFDSHKAIDVLDYEFYNSLEHFTLSVKRDGAVTVCEVDKYEDEDLGLNFDREIPPVECKNNCIFCFVRQLPKKELRPTLRIKDDDYRHSFLSGNYITMTNLSDDDIERIIRLRLKPLYISVHSSDLKLRNELLGVKRAPDIMEQMRKLYNGGITMHAQVVYCPGINDDYIKTAREIEPYTLSLAVVPVGLTKDCNPQLRPVKKEEAIKAIEQIELLQEELLKKRGTRYVYAADELYLKAEREIPPYEAYEDFSQIENGVGLIAQFKKDFDDALFDSEGRIGHISIATGVGAYPLIREAAEKLVHRFGGVIDVYAIENEFFGKTVTVAGLVTGGDILRTLNGKDLGERLLIPSVMLREFKDVFLDDMTVKQLENALKTKVEAIPSDGYSFVKRILK